MIYVDLFYVAPVAFVEVCWSLSAGQRWETLGSKTRVVYAALGLRATRAERNKETGVGFGQQPQGFKSWLYYFTDSVKYGPSPLKVIIYFLTSP